jgi:hypothetical protein
VTPATIAQANVPDDVKRAASQRLRDAVQLADEFLASDARLTLPPGRFELDDVEGTRFVTALGTWPAVGRCNTWGDVVAACGFAAQEREYGFACGARAANRDRAVDNSWLEFDDGELKPPPFVAELLLHETTHDVFREGTVGFWNGVAYYLEAVFLLRANDHSAERHARATSEEFTWFCMRRDAKSDFERAAFDQVVADHLAQKHPHCEHGPFTEPPPPAPIAPHRLETP